MYFESQKLGFYTKDDQLITFDLMIGLIPTQFQTLEYFNEIERGALGLLPSIPQGDTTSQDRELAAQFLYTI